MRVCLINRKPMAGQFSINQLYRTIADEMEKLIDVQWHEVSHYSVGLKNRLKIIRECSRLDGDVLHVTGDINFAVYGTDPSKSIITVHDLGHLGMLSGLRRQLYKKLWWSWPIHRVKKVVAISEYTKSLLVKELSISTAKISVVPDCVSPEFTWSRKEFNVEQPSILHVGTGENKNLPRLIEAIKGLPVRLTIIGSPSINLEHKMRDYGIVYRLRKNISAAEVAEEYQKCDLVSFVSLNEGFGLPIVEAQATGRPLITANNTSMPEVAGKGALLVPADDIGKIREAIKKICDDPNLRNKLIEEGRKNVERFKPMAVAKALVEVYEELLYEKE